MARSSREERSQFLLELVDSCIDMKCAAISSTLFLAQAAAMRSIVADAPDQEVSQKLAVLEMTIERAVRYDYDRNTAWKRLAYGAANSVLLLLRGHRTKIRDDQGFALLTGLAGKCTHVQQEEQASSYLLAAQIDLIKWVISRGVGSAHAAEAMATLESEMNFVEEEEMLQTELDGTIHKLSRGLVFLVETMREIEASNGAIEDVAGTEAGQVQAANGAQEQMNETEAQDGAVDSPLDEQYAGGSVDGRMEEDMNGEGSAADVARIAEDGGEGGSERGQAADGAPDLREEIEAQYGAEDQMDDEEVQDGSEDSPLDQQDTGGSVDDPLEMNQAAADAPIITEDCGDIEMGQADIADGERIAEDGGEGPFEMGQAADEERINIVDEQDNGQEASGAMDVVIDKAQNDVYASVDEEEAGRSDAVEATASPIPDAAVDEREESAADDENECEDMDVTVPCLKSPEAQAAEAQIRMDACRRNTGVVIKRKHPALFADTNLLVNDFCILALQKPVDDVKEIINCTFGKCAKLESVNVSRGANMSDADYEDFCSLFTLLLHLNKLTKRKDMWRLEKLYIETEVQGRRVKTLLDQLVAQGISHPSIVASRDRKSLYVTLMGTLVPVRGGIQDAMLSLLAVYYIFDFEFADGVRDVMAFFWRTLGLPIAPLPHAVTRTLKRVKAL